MNLRIPTARGTVPVLAPQWPRARCITTDHPLIPRANKLLEQVNKKLAKAEPNPTCDGWIVTLFDAMDAGDFPVLDHGLVTGLARMAYQLASTGPHTRNGLTPDITHVALGWLAHDSNPHTRALHSFIVDGAYYLGMYGGDPQELFAAALETATQGS